MKYFIQTFGCQMNVYDSESIVGLLNAAGHVHTAVEDEAELILLNTCSIRESAENRVRGRIGQLKKYKDKGRLKYLGVCGCMGQKEGRRLTDTFPYLDLVIGPGAVGSITRLVDELERGNTPILDLTGIDDEFDQPFPAAAEAISYPRFVTIMKGCNKRCTYCVVPSVRGPERSRAPNIILQEMETLVRRGYKEITLIGQTVNSYRYDGTKFPQLLEMADKIPGIERIRFATSYPGFFMEDLFDTMVSLNHVCEQLHLPFQSGSNRILKAMRRSYTREKYLEQISLFRSRYKERDVKPSVSTDVIVGFPGETEEDFELTLDLMNTVRFDSAFMFKFSPRRGTPAASLENQVDENTKARRLDRLIEIQHQISLELNREALGKKTEIMLERINPDAARGTVIEGRLRTGRIVKLQTPVTDYKIGDIIKVKITDSSSYSLKGVACEKEANVHVAQIA